MTLLVHERQLMSRDGKKCDPGIIFKMPLPLYPAPGSAAYPCRIAMMDLASDMVWTGYGDQDRIPYGGGA
ncbi:MAG: hypothetical protein QHG99_02475 [Methanomicrobiales archaeon]|nr:hypothetical protein [Methanomicrobiales archaeon]